MTLLRTEYRTCAVFLMQDRDTQRVYPLLLAAGGEVSSDAATVWEHGAPNRSAAGGGWVKTGFVPIRRSERAGRLVEQVECGRTRGATLNARSYGRTGRP
jgi:hypothetical protein